LLKILNRFRWAFCQLETLRHCLPPSIRHTLDELPESLDETYERILKEIKKPNRDYARRLLQCLVVAIRPLRVEELAEVLAVDFDDAEGIPKLNPNWRWEDEEQALLTSCSSLIVIVEANNSRVVQFSHFSVKEFLISTRLATSSRDVSRYHIDFEPAHTILAQACLGVLLQPLADDCVEENNVRSGSSLAEYAAQHWVTHAQFESVSMSLRRAMEYLFDLDKPYFAAWLELHNIDIRLGSDDSSLYWIAPWFTSCVSSASPLYYAALCGFQCLAERLVVKYPQHVNASGGYYMSPLVVALTRGHFQIAELLHHSGAHPNVYGCRKYTPLHSAAQYGDVKMVQTLLDYEADVHAQCIFGYTPIFSVSLCFGPSSAIHNGIQSFPDVARLLLEHGVDVNGPTDVGNTPLHAAAENGTAELVHVLLEHGASIGAEDKKGRTPLHEAAKHSRVELDVSVEVARVLLEHGANVGAEDKEGRTPSHAAGQDWLLAGPVEVMRVMFEHGANVGAEDKKGRTPLHEAAQNGHVKLVGVLLEHGADVGAEDKEGRTPLHGAVENGHVKPVGVLLEHGANVSAEDKEGRTPLHETAQKGFVKPVGVLLEHGANVGAEDKKGRSGPTTMFTHGSLFP
jgi:ankyrin repeat protein